MLMGCWTLRRRKCDKSRRQFEGGSAPSGQEALTVVITDDSTEELQEFQGKSQDVGEFRKRNRLHQVVVVVNRICLFY